MVYSFDKSETNNIIENFGQAFYEKVKRDLDTYSKKWKLEILKMVDYYSANSIFICKSQLFGDAILKICNPSRYVLTEVNTLREYNGGKFCRVFDSDIKNGIILEERIKPGVQLKYEKSVEKRIAVFSSLFKGLHIKAENPELYTTYLEWTENITEYMSKRNDHKDFYLYMKKAKDICTVIDSSYSRKMLLHGDFHYDNILLGSDGKYKIIDPKGVIGDPVFDLPRYILNEYYDEEENTSAEELKYKINKIIDYFEATLNIPKKVIKQCFFVEMSMGACWEIQDGDTPDIMDIIFAEKIMNN